MLLYSKFHFKFCASIFLICFFHGNEACSRKASKKLIEKVTTNLQDKIRDTSKNVVTDVLKGNNVDQGDALEAPAPCNRTVVLH